MSEANEITPPTALRVKQGPKGRGVYAARDIAEGETIEICPTLEIAEDDASGLLGDYILNSNRDPANAVLMLGYGGLYNHSYDPNAEYVEHTEDTLAFNAVKPIAAGEEITIDYGEAWWVERDLEPE
jgi:SET domain-containing protein